jgi:multidrug efflux pump subunit AcrA (membrane-fusion protein)
VNARTLAVAAAVVAVLPWLPGAPRARAEGGPPPQAVRVEEIRAEKHRVHRRATGAVRSVRRALVAAREPGIVEALEVREGAVVRKGDLLARLDAGRLVLEAAAAEADILEAGASADALRADEERARRDLGALEGLASRDAARPKEREDAGSVAAAAAARVRAAEARAASFRARRDLLRRRIADAGIRAPFDGAVVLLRTEVGAWVGEGEAVVELA